MSNIVLLLDLTCFQIEVRQIFLNNAICAIKKWCNIAVNSNKSLPARCIRLSILAIDSSTVELVIPIHELSIYTVHSSLNRLTLQHHNDTSVNVSDTTGEMVDTVHLGLQVAVSMLDKQKQMVPTYNTSNYNDRIVLLTCNSGIQFSDKSLSVLDKLFSNNIMVSLIHAKHNQMAQISKQEAEKLVKYPNCTVTNIFNNSRHLEFAIFHNLNQAINFRPFHYQYAKLIFSGLETEDVSILCTMGASAVEDLAIKSDLICHCHKQSVNKTSKDSGIAYCSLTQKQIDKNDILGGIRIGNEVIPTTYGYSSTTNVGNCVELQVLNKIDLDRMSISLLYGRSIILYPATNNGADWGSDQHNILAMTTLIDTLQQNRQGLLVKSSFNVDTKEEDQDMSILYYYLIMVDENGTSLYMRRLVTSDEYIPNNISLSRKNSEQRNQVSQDVIRVMKSVECITYSPLEFSSRIHQYIDHIIAIRDSGDNKPRRMNSNRVVEDDENGKEAKGLRTPIYKNRKHENQYSPTCPLSLNNKRSKPSTTFGNVLSHLTNKTTNQSTSRLSKRNSRK